MKFLKVYSGGRIGQTFEIVDLTLIEVKEELKRNRKLLKLYDVYETKLNFYKLEEIK